MSLGKKWLLMMMLVLAVFDWGFAQGMGDLSPSYPLPTNHQVETRINKALPKAIAGTVIWGLGELCGWTIVYPKDKELEDKLFDLYDEETGDSISYQDRAEELLGESMQVLLLSIPFRAMTIAGVTAACVATTKSTSTTRSLFDKSKMKNPVWAPYIAGWVVGVVGSAAGMISGFTESREPLTFARVMGVGQSCLWGTASVLTIVTSARNKGIAQENSKASLLPSIDGENYGLTLQCRF